MNSDKYPKIRSFVRRQGRLSQVQQQALTTLWKYYGLTVEAGICDFDKIFQRTAERVLEIGFGMGDSLIAQAQQNPQKDFLGVEVHKPGIGKILAAIHTFQLKNLRIFSADVVEVLQNCIPDNNFVAVQLFFPDPWPKRRHHKRRLVQSKFVELIRKKLVSNGKFYLATDWEDYANQMMQVLSVAPGFTNAFGEKQFALRPIERLLTKFESRGMRLGHRVWDLLFVKNN